MLIALFYSIIIHFNDTYVFNIYIVFIFGDLSCMESLLQIILMVGFPIFVLFCLFVCMPSNCNKLN